MAWERRFKMAFYAMQLPLPLCPYFGLPFDVRAGDLGIREVDGVAISPWQRITPAFAAIPMGWTRSLYICQQVLEGIARQHPNIRADNALTDRSVAPDIDPLIHTE